MERATWPLNHIKLHQVRRTREWGLNLAWIVKHKDLNHCSSSIREAVPICPSSSPIKSLFVYYMRPFFCYDSAKYAAWEATLLRFEIIRGWKRWWLWPCQVHSLTLSALSSVLISWLLPIVPWEKRSFWLLAHPHCSLSHRFNRDSLCTRTLFSAYTAIKQACFTRKWGKEHICVEQWPFGTF